MTASRISFALVALLHVVTSHAQVVVKDAFDCPTGSKKMAGLDGADFCISGDGASSAEEDLFTKKTADPIKIIHKKRGEVVEIGNYGFGSKFVEQWIMQYSADSRAALGLSASYPVAVGYVVDPSTLVLGNNIQFNGADKVRWSILRTSQKGVSLMNYDPPCIVGKNRVNRAEIGGSVEAERVETGSMFRKCSSLSKVRPFTTHLACTDKNSGKKLEFILKAPAQASLRNEKDDPVYLGFKVDGVVVFWKKLASTFKAGDEFYSLADKVRPKFLKTPTDVALDAAFDCFDHLVWKEAGDAINPKPDQAPSADRYDAAIIASQLNGITLAAPAQLKRETDAALKEIGKLEAAPQLKRDPVKAQGKK